MRKPSRLTVSRTPPRRGRSFEQSEFCMRQQFSESQCGGQAADAAADDGDARRCAGKAVVEGGRVMAGVTGWQLNRKRFVNSKHNRITSS